MDTIPAPLEGIAITALVSSNGTWQYDIGGGWVDVGAVTPTTALLLRATDSLRFVPDAENSDSASITFRAWDQSDGETEGTKVNATVTALEEGLTTREIELGQRGYDSDEIAKTEAREKQQRRRDLGLALISSTIFPWPTNAGECDPVDASANNICASRARMSIWIFRWRPGRRPWVVR